MSVCLCTDRRRTRHLPLPSPTGRGYESSAIPQGTPPRFSAKRRVLRKHHTQLFAKTQRFSCFANILSLCRKQARGGESPGAAQMRVKIAALFVKRPLDFCQKGTAHIREAACKSLPHPRPHSRPPPLIPYHSEARTLRGASWRRRHAERAAEPARIVELSAKIKQYGK